jgi:hypothetical protein
MAFNQSSIKCMAFLLEDDDEIIEAALALVDEYAVEGSSGCASSVSSSAASSVQGEDDWSFASCSSVETTTDNQQPSLQSARCRAPVRLTTPEDKARRRMEINEKTRILRKKGVYANSNRVRNGRTREIAFLREQVEKLQIDVATLKQKSRRGGASAQICLDAAVLPARNPKMWQAVLEIQRRRREEAENENIHLKLVAERQRKVADTLVSTLQKQATGLMTECSSFNQQNCEPHPLANALVFSEGFQELFRHLEAAYAEVDTVFAANGLSRMVDTSDDVHIREEGDGTYSEAFSNKVLHFGLRAAMEATWEHFKGSEKHLGNGNIYEKTARDLDEPYTVVEEFTKELFSRRSHVDIKVKQVIRRYLEPDRDVVIWVARVSPAEIKHKMLRGLTYHLRGYAVTKRSVASTPDHEVSQLQCCSMISIDPEAAIRFSHENLRSLSNFLIASTALKMQAHQDRIESSLVQLARNQQTSSRDSEALLLGL